MFVLLNGEFLGIYAYIEVTFKWTLVLDSDFIFHPPLPFPLEHLPAIHTFKIQVFST